MSCDPETKRFYRAAYGCNLLDSAWTPFTWNEPGKTEQLFDLKLREGVDCLYWYPDGYVIDRTKVITSTFTSSSGKTTHSMKSSATESEKAALSLAFEKVTAKIEHKHSNSRSSSTADTDKFTYFISSVESIDVKAKISSMHRPPFTTEFTEKVMKVFEANGTDARKEQLTELVKSYTFYLKEVYAGSSYAQVGEQKTTQVSFIDH